MGTYLNLGNSGFAEILKSEYVDKTVLIRMINATIGTKQKCTCISRPRRFGKSYAAQMLCAYYDLSCDSRQLFEKYEISADEGFEKNINHSQNSFYGMFFFFHMFLSQNDVFK